MFLVLSHTNHYFSLFRWEQIGSKDLYHLQQKKTSHSITVWCWNKSRKAYLWGKLSSWAFWEVLSSSYIIYTWPVELILNYLALYFFFVLHCCNLTVKIQVELYSFNRTTLDMIHVLLFNHIDVFFLRISLHLQSRLLTYATLVCNHVCNHVYAYSDTSLETEHIWRKSALISRAHTTWFFK